jgi:hypothetical protein
MKNGVYSILKAIFLINEEEKNRILNLHESATKRQYLSEQTTTTSSDDIQKTMKENTLR